MCFLLSMELREKWQRTSNAWLLCPWSHKQFWNGGKIAGGPFLRASLSCLFAWQVWTLGCFSYLIMNTAVGFGHRPEVAQWRRELVSLTRVNSQISALWRTVTWYRPSFTSRQCRIRTLWKWAAVSPDGPWPQQITTYSPHCYWLWRVILKVIQRNPHFTMTFAFHGTQSLWHLLEIS